MQAKTVTPEMLRRVANQQKDNPPPAPLPSGEGTSYAQALGDQPPAFFADDDTAGFTDPMPMTQGGPTFTPPPAPAPTPTPEPPPSKCLHCGGIPDRLEGDEPTETEKVTFQHCVLADEFTPFEKSYLGFGDALKVTFRSITFGEARTINDQVMKEYAEKTLESVMAVAWRERDLWLGASVAAIAKKTAGGWKVAYAAPAPAADPDPEGCFRAIGAAINGNAQLLEVLFRLRTQFAAFVARLELAITDPNFYGPAGSAT